MSPNYCLCSCAFHRNLEIFTWGAVCAEPGRLTPQTLRPQSQTHKKAILFTACANLMSQACENLCLCPSRLLRRNSLNHRTASPGTCPLFLNLGIPAFRRPRTCAESRRPRAPCWGPERVLLPGVLFGKLSDLSRVPRASGNRAGLTGEEGTLAPFPALPERILLFPPYLLRPNVRSG